MQSSKLSLALAAGLMASMPSLPLDIRERQEFDFPYTSKFYKGHSTRRKPRPVGVKFSEQYKKRYGSVTMNKTASGFLGFRKVRKFIPKNGMSIWVKPDVRLDLPAMK